MKPRFLAAQGCHAARRHESGVVVLDFGKPAFAHGGYGTILFSGRFAPNHKITAAMLALRARLRPLPPAGLDGVHRARARDEQLPPVRAERLRGRRPLGARDEQARARAAPARARRPTSRLRPPTTPSRRGIRSSARRGTSSTASARRCTGHTLYDYGSLDGGVGAVWSARQALYVAGGLRHTKALPEIYNSAMAREWAELARIAHRRYHRRRPLRRRHDAGHRELRLRAPAAARRTTPSCTRSAPGHRPRSAARRRHEHRRLEGAGVGAGFGGAGLTSSRVAGSGARARRRSSRCRRRPPRPGRPAASARSRAARRGRRAR